MELYILSKQDLSILSICKISEYQINLDEETNAKSTFTLMKTDGLKKNNYMVLNGLYRQFLFVIDDVNIEKGSDVVIVTALDISNMFDRKVIEKNTDMMTSNSIEEFIANTMSENFVNSDDVVLNVGYIDIYRHTNTQAKVATNAENGLYNFHTFLTNCRQYKNIYTDFKLENIGNPQVIEGKQISIESRNRPLADIVVKGETKQDTRSGKNLFDNTVTPVIQTNSTREVLDTGIRIISKRQGTNSYDYNLFVLKKLTDYVGKTVRMKVNPKASAENKPLYGIGISTEDGTSRTKKTKDVGSGEEISFVVPELTNGKEYLMVWLYINAGGTVAIGDYVDYTDLIVTIDNEDMTYEPYGASPSPDYPSEIENIDNVEIKITRNNILKGLSTPKTDSDYWSAVSEYTFTPLENGWGKFNFDNSEGTSTAFINAKVKLNAINLKPNTLYSLIAEIRNSNISENSGAFFTIQTANIAAAWKESKSIGYTAINNGGVYKFTATTKDDFTGVEHGLDSYLRLAKGTSGTIEIRLSVIEGDYDITDFEYEEYKSQTETFPLAEGQKLYEGSYLADDGIHNKFRELSLAIADMNSSETYPGWTNLTQLKEDYPSQNTRLNRLCNNAYCNITKNKEAIIVNTKGPGVLCLATDGFGLTQTEWKEQYPDLVFNLQYELPEEEIIPYTEEQQEAWDRIKALTLYEGINNINCEANIVLTYYPLIAVGMNFVLRIDIENKEETAKLIDTTLSEVTDYNKIYEEDVTAKVIVLIRENGSEYNLYLRTDRTTTTNKNDPDRASGKIEVISVETADLAEQEALNVIKGNSYNHLVEFKIAKTSKLMDITQLHIGRPIRIKTDDEIYDSYISAITLSDENFVYFKSGNLRTTLLDKLKKNTSNTGNKLDKTGGIIQGNLNIDGVLKENGNKVITDYKYYRGSCNDITDTCVVYVSNGTDCPEELNGVNYGFLFTKAINENYIVQTFEDMNSDRSWLRRKLNGTWHEWTSQGVNDCITLITNRHTQSFAAAWAFYEVSNMYVCSQKGDSLLRETTTGNSVVTIGAGVSKVKVSGAITCNNSTSLDRSIAILQNNTELYSFYLQSISTYHGFSIPPIIINVTEGDRIRLGIAIGADNTSSEILSGNLTVEVVE